MKKLNSILYNCIFSKFRSRNTHNDIIVKIRRFLMKSICLHIGKNVNFQQGVKVRTPQNLIVGNNSGFGINSYIYCEGGVEVGDNVIIGPEIMIFTANHIYNNEANFNNSGYKYDKVIIKNNVWIGARTIILPGVTVESGVVIAAGSVVTKGHLKENCIYGGNPAKLIRNRYE